MTNKEYIDNYAKQMLNKARAIWSSSPNQEGASDVAEIISQIPANASWRRFAKRSRSNST